MFKKWINNLIAFFKRLFAPRKISFTPPRSRETIKPVILIPGSSASIQRFNATVRMLSHASHKKHSLLKIKVLKNYELEIEGRLNTSSKNPMIVIGFENNRDGYKNIQLQIDYLKTALRYLLEHYQIKEFKAIGHSNGGLVLTGLLEDGFLEQEGLSISKLAILGSPYTFNKEMHQDFQKRRWRIPRQLSVLNLVGEWTAKSDGIVPLASAQAAKDVFSKQDYQQVILNGRKAHHSALPTNPEAIKELQMFLGL